MSAKNSTHSEEHARGATALQFVAVQNQKHLVNFSVGTSTVQGGLVTQIPSAGAFFTG